MEGPLDVNLHSSLQELHSENEFRPLSAPQPSTIALHFICYVYKPFFKQESSKI